MTNAIEQTKREMYDNLERVRRMIKDGCVPTRVFPFFEETFEAHLEELRRESMDTLGRLAAMTEERDQIQQRLHAIDHAYCEQSNNLSRMANEIDNLKIANQVAGEELRKAHELIEAQRQTIKRSVSLCKALSEKRNQQASTSAQDSKENVPSDQADALMTVIGAMIDCQQIVSDWAVYGHKAKDQMRKLSDVLHGTPALTEAMKSFEKADRCMHSFHPAFPSGEQCIFCGVKREDECAHDFASNGGCPECGALMP